MKGKNGHEKSSSHRRAKVDHLPQSEWYFEQVPDHLVHHCWLWEFCRELYWQNEELREAVEAYWNRLNQKDDWHCHVRHEGWWPDSRASEVFATENIFWRADPLGEGRLRYLTREELCSIRDRHHCLSGCNDVIGKNLTDEEVIYSLMDFDRGLGLQEVFPEILTLVCNKELGESREEITIDWAKTDSELVKHFSRWLKKRRLDNGSLPSLSSQQGKGKRPFEMERTQLKKLGALRLDRFYTSFPEVVTALNKQKLNLPYVDTSNWSKAISAAQAVLHRFGRKCLQDLRPKTNASVSG